MATLHSDSGDTFLPDFCADGTLLLIVVIAELLALVLTLATWPLAPFWPTLAMTSLFAQWIALGSVAALCRMKKYLRQASPFAGAVTAYAVILFVTLAFSFLAAAFMDVFIHPDAANWRYEMDFVLKNAIISSIISAIGLRYLYLQHDWKRSMEARMTARLHALQARIRPHFLFNSMNTIAALIQSRPRAAEQAVEDLSGLFRSVLREGEWARLGDEIELCRRYLALESLRLGKRLRVSWRLSIDPADEDRLVPALCLQPLVENAVYHGIQVIPEGGELTITIAREGREFRLEVANPRPAIMPGSHHGGQGMALANIRERLRLGYRQAQMIIQEEAERFTVTLRLPVGEMEEEHADFDRG